MSPSYLNIENSNNKKAIIAILSWSIAINFFLAVATIVIGIFSEIHAVILDGVHSFSDLFSDILLMVAVPFVYKSKDETHHFGHARYEDVLSIIIGMMILVSAVPFITQAVYHLFKNPDTPVYTNLWVWGITILTIILKEYLYRWTIRVGKELNSPMLIANGQHHRGDVFSSLLVIIALVGIYLGLYWFDDIISLFLGCYLLYIGTKIVIEAMHVLTDRAPKGGVEAVSTLLKEVEGVYSFHDLRLRQSGPFLMGDVHLELDSRLTIVEAHKIIKEAQIHLREALPQLRDFTIHVDPYEIHKKKSQ